MTAFVPFVWGTVTSMRPSVTLKMAPFSFVYSASVIVLLLGAPFGQSLMTSAAEAPKETNAATVATVRIALFISVFLFPVQTGILMLV